LLAPVITPILTQKQNDRDRCQSKKCIGLVRDYCWTALVATANHLRVRAHTNELSRQVYQKAFGFLLQMQNYPALEPYSY
jgi:hypothetical protein